jgi:hypothetical protein
VHEQSDGPEADAIGRRPGASEAVARNLQEEDVSKPEITKVKLKDNRVEIHAEQKIGNAGDGTKVTVLRCSDAPAESFNAAVTALVPHVRGILMLQPKQWEGCIDVVGVSFSRTETEEDEFVDGAVITCVISLDTANSPLVINTPHLLYEQYSPTGEAPLMPEDAQDALNDLKREAEAYLNGKRAQGDLFEEAA